MPSPLATSLSRSFPAAASVLPEAPSMMTDEKMSADGQSLLTFPFADAARSPRYPLVGVIKTKDAWRRFMTLR